MKKYLFLLLLVVVTTNITAFFIYTDGMACTDNVSIARHIEVEVTDYNAPEREARWVEEQQIENKLRYMINFDAINEHAGVSK